MAARHQPYPLPSHHQQQHQPPHHSPTESTESNTSSSHHSTPQSGQPVFLEPPKKLQRTTDKSCVVCRERRVRCGREWPTCTRCLKRREECVYGDGITVETKEQPVEDPRVKQLETKLAALESQLAAAQTTTSPRPTPASQAQAFDLLPVLTQHKAPTLVSSIQSALSPLSDQESATLLYYLVQGSFGHQYLGPLENLDWRLAQGRMAELLTIHLMDAAFAACCSRLASLKPLMDRIPYYKSNLHILGASDQASVSLICAVGARSSPHSAVLGLEIPGLADGTAAPAVYLSVGSRREKACRSLTERASELCWLGGTLQASAASRGAVEMLVGLAQLLIFEEVRPRKSRFYLRNAVGMFSDLQGDPEMSAEGSKELRQILGSALYFDDAIHSAQLSKHPLIPTSDLDLFFASTGLNEPDFSQKHLSQLLEETLAPPRPQGQVVHGGAGGSQGPAQEEKVTEKQLQKALDVTGVWVCYLQRSFARLTTARRPEAPSVLAELSSLWQQIDIVHSAVQRLQNYFVNMQQTPSSSSPSGTQPAPPPGPHSYTTHTPTPNLGLGTGKGSTPSSPPSRSPAAPERPSDHYVLLAVRADTRLVDLVNLMHEFLGREDIVDVWGEGKRDEWVLVRKMREESEMRVRKCLKLVAFYARLYLSSQDKHVVHHLTMQLELLPLWTKLAVQTVGQPGGPTSAEFEVTNEELDWFLSALRLALFYTPKAATRLQELTEGKAKRSRTSSAGTPSLSHSRAQSRSPPSPFLPQPTLHGAPTYPSLGAPTFPRNNSNRGSGGSGAPPTQGLPNGHRSTGLAMPNSQSPQEFPTAPSQNAPYQAYHLPPAVSPPAAPTPAPAAAAAPNPHHPQAPDPLSLSLPMLNPSPSLPSPSARSYSPYRPSTTSLPTAGYPSPWAFSPFGIPSLSPHYERENPFGSASLREDPMAMAGGGAAQNWMDLGGGGWGAAGGVGGKSDVYGTASGDGDEWMQSGGDAQWVNGGSGQLGGSNDWGAQGGAAGGGGGGAGW